MGTLYYGECWRTATVLDILRRYLKDDSVDVVYLDPPFNSAQNYNAFFQEKDPALARKGWAVTEQPGKVSDVMQVSYTFLGGNDARSGGQSSARRRWGERPREPARQ